MDDDKRLAQAFRSDLILAIAQAQEVIKTMDDSVRPEELRKHIKKEGLIGLAIDRVLLASEKITDGSADIIRAIDDLEAYEKANSEKKPMIAKWGVDLGLDPDSGPDDLIKAINPKWGTKLTLVKPTKPTTKDE